MLINRYKQGYYLGIENDQEREHIVKYYKVVFSFLFFKLWKYDDTFTGDLENIEQSFI